MSNLKISELTSLSTQPEDGDLFTVVDVSDTTDASSGTTKKITAVTAIPLSTISVKGRVKLSTAPASATEPIAVGDNDTRVPSQGENDALVGSSGTPSSTNKYVTTDDVSDAAASGKIVRATGTALPALSGANLTNLPAIQYSSGTVTITDATSNFTSTIAHGLGKIPTMVRVTVFHNYYHSYSIYNSSSQKSVSRWYAEGGSPETAIATTLRIFEDSDQYFDGVITTDATNITITWTESATAAQVSGNLIWEAQY